MSGGEGGISPEVRRRFLVFFLINVAMLAVLGVRSEVATHSARAAVARVEVNAQRIDQNAYRACTDLNAGFARSNAVIETAIQAEKRKPTDEQDLKRISDLENFKQTIRDCGTKP